VKGDTIMGRLLRFVLILAVVAAIGGAVYVYIFDLPPPTRAVDKDVSDALAGR